MTATTREALEREAFEAWRRRTSKSPKSYDPCALDGMDADALYADRTTRAMWAGWKAAALSRPSQQAAAGETEGAEAVATPMVHNCCGREVCDGKDCPNNGPWYKVPKWRMDAYYYGFEPTGVASIDRILSAVACAGKAYHHTEDWTADAGERDHLRGTTPVEWIQNAANDAAKAHPTPVSAAPGAPGDTDAQRAAWLADKIAALGDYAREAAAMLQRWPVSAEEARALLSKAAIQLRLHNAHGNHRTDPAFIEDIERTAAGVSAEEALDAARLDWLERQDLNELVTMRRRTNGDVGVNVGRGPFFGKTLREALDAARGEERKAS